MIFSTLKIIAFNRPRYRGFGGLRVSLKFLDKTNM